MAAANPLSLEFFVQVQISDKNHQSRGYNGIIALLSEVINMLIAEYDYDIDIEEFINQIS